MEHTKGEWTVQYVADYPFSVSSGDRAICDISAKELDVISENQANAKLIASAPELLQSCKDLMILITPYLKDRNLIGDGDKIQEGFNQAKELIENLTQ